MERAFCILGLLIAASFAQSEVNLKNTGNGEDQIFLHGGVERSYKIYRPKNLPKDSPMLLLLHGQGSSNRWTYTTGFNALAEQYNFLMVYPQSHKKEARLDGSLAKQPGMPKHLVPMFEKIAKCEKDEVFTYSAMNFTCQANGVGVTHVVMWNHTHEDSLFDNQSDTAFLTSLAKTLQQKFSIDPEKIFVSGFSNGGFMSYSLICEEKTLFKAAAVVAGLIDKTVLQNCTKRPTPVIHFHGEEDSMVPIEGNKEQGSPSAQSIVEYFAKINDSVTIERIKVTPSTVQTIYSPKYKGAKAQFYRIEGHDHVWPGRLNEVKKGMDNSGINATELIWDFFSAL